MYRSSAWARAVQPLRSQQVALPLTNQEDRFVHVAHEGHREHDHQGGDGDDPALQLEPDEPVPERMHDHGDGHAWGVPRAEAQATRTAAKLPE